MANVSMTKRRGLTPQQRRSRYLWAVVIAYLVINPLFLYRFPALADALMLNGLGNFTGFWSQNPVGFSLTELIGFTLAVPFHTQLFGYTLPAAALWIITLVLAIFCVIASHKIIRYAWLAKSSFNKGWMVFSFLKYGIVVGGLVAIVMLGINLANGQSFTVWTIIEVILWTLPAVVGMVIAAGLCWAFENRSISGNIGTNVTMGDSRDFDDKHDHGHHHHDDDTDDQPIR